MDGQITATRDPFWPDAAWSPDDREVELDRQGARFRTGRLAQDEGPPRVRAPGGVRPDWVDEAGNARVYIGEADELRARISQHYSGPGAKGFWTRAIAFTSKDENFNKAHVRFIESRLVARGHGAKRVILENGNAPAEPALSESDRSEAETFLEEMLVIYPLLGVDAFVVPIVLPSAPAPLQLRARGIVASGHDSPEGFVVHAGSQAALTEVPSLHDYLRKLRANLVTSGALAADAGLYRVTQDYTFDSPSTASGAMLGRTSNGRVEWKDAQGRSLRDIQEAAVDVSLP